MTEVLLRITGRLALCAGATWLAWRFGGLELMLLSLPMLGVALARPLLDLAGEWRHGIRAAAWRRLEGRHFVYRGTPVQVLEDVDQGRWVRAADVRAIVGRTASDGALALTYPGGWRAMGRPAEPHFSAEALIEHLGKERSPEAVPFRRWVERDIAYPTRRTRERLGIHRRTTDFRASE